MLLAVLFIKNLPSRYRFLLILIFSLILLEGCDQLTSGSKSKDDTEEVRTNAEQMPQFKGGQEELINFISKEVKYPGNAKDMGVDGTVYVSFIVEKDGSVSSAKIQKGVYADLNNEAIRVVEAMPKWIPAEHKGKKVPVELVLPIRFELPDADKKS